MDARAQEEHAGAILREQFYRAYPVLKDSADMVDGLLAEKFNEVLASGRLKKSLTPAEGEALKAESFADVAAKATRKIVGLMNAEKKIASPSAPSKKAGPSLSEAYPRTPSPGQLACARGT